MGGGDGCEGRKDGRRPEGMRDERRCEGMEKKTQELDELINQLDRSNVGLSNDDVGLQRGDDVTYTSDNADKYDDETTCKESINPLHQAAYISSDDYGETSDSSDSEASSVSSKEPERHSIDMLFERLQLDHSDDLMAAVDARNAQKSPHEVPSKTNAGVLERDNTMPTFEWELPPESTFSLGSLDRNFTLNPHDLIYAHKYVQNHMKSTGDNVSKSDIEAHTDTHNDTHKNTHKDTHTHGSVSSLSHKLSGGELSVK